MSDMSRRAFVVGAAASFVFSKLACAEANLPLEHPYPGVWPSEPPAGCPFTRSIPAHKLYFTGRHRRYADADTWYPSWASNNVQYSCFADGDVLNTHGKAVDANCGVGFKSDTGYAKIVGNDPMRLEVVGLGTWPGSGMPYDGRYPCANLVHNGVWYSGTYCVDLNERKVVGRWYNWAWLGPFMGCRYSKDYGETWTASPCKPWAPLFPEDIGYKGPQIHALEYRKKVPGGGPAGTDVGAMIPGLPLPKLGVMHFVDFGKNMEHSPDGKTYLVGHGNAPDTPHPRLGAVSWLSGNAIYLTRLHVSPETINDASHYEFFAGYDSSGHPIWSRRFSEMKPMLEWINHLGSVTITYNPGWKKYIMCICDGWPSTEMMNTILMEADKVTGPWKMLSYLKDFGSQGYFVNIPSKFIQSDGKTFWLCYSANFTNGNHWNGPVYVADPPGSGYGLCLQEVKLIQT